MDIIHQHFHEIIFLTNNYTLDFNTFQLKLIKPIVSFIQFQDLGTWNTQLKQVQEQQPHSISVLQVSKQIIWTLLYEYNT